MKIATSQPACLVKTVILTLFFINVSFSLELHMSKTIASFYLLSTKCYASAFYINKRRHDILF